MRFFKLLKKRGFNSTSTYKTNFKVIYKLVQIKKDNLNNTIL
jgi:hypothetical protein